jgi:hypothetical protein
MLFKNLRDGTFRDVAADVGLHGVVGATTSVAAGDINNDDFPDFFFGRADAPGLFAISDGRGGFTVTAAPDASRAARAAQLVDYDNDGRLDLVTWSADGPRLFRHRGLRWDDVTAAAPVGNAAASAAPARLFAAGDLNLDGAVDIVTADPAGALALFRNDIGARNRSLRVQLKGRVSNRSAVGSKVQIRAGSMGARIETSAATPPASPADVVFGLGRRAGVDVVRVLWPSGVRQAEITDRPGPQAGLASRLSIEELDRKPSSCPMLYTWNGQRFEFVTDFMGGGEMGYWEAPGVRNTPDPTEYVLIRGDQLRPNDGHYDLRVTNALEETLFVDGLQLIAITHPNDVDIFPNEGMTIRPSCSSCSHARAAPPAVDEHAATMSPHASHPSIASIRTTSSCCRPRLRRAAHADAGSGNDRRPPGCCGWDRLDRLRLLQRQPRRQPGRPRAAAPGAASQRSERAWRTIVPTSDSGGDPDAGRRPRRIDARPGKPAAHRHQHAGTGIDCGRELGASGRSSVARIDPASARLRWRGFSAEVRPEAASLPATTTTGVAGVAVEDDDRSIHACRRCAFLLLPHGRHVRDQRRATRSRFRSTPRRRTDTPTGWTCVPAVRRRLQQGDGHQLGEPRRGRTVAVPRDDPLSYPAPEGPQHHAYRRYGPVQHSGALE